MTTSTTTQTAALASAQPARQPSRWAVRIRDILTSLYLTRFSLILMIVLVAFGPFALWAVPAMFRSMLVLTSIGLAFVTLAALGAAITVLATRRVVLLYGPTRFDVPWAPTKAELGLRSFLGHLTLALPLVATATILSVSEGSATWGPAVLGVVTGGVMFAFALTIVAGLLAFLADKNESLPDLITPARASLVKTLHLGYQPLPRPGGIALGALLERVRPFLGPGYFTEKGEIESGHLFSAGVFAVYVALYLGGYFLFHPGTRLGADVPALVHLLTAVTLITWVLAGIAFLLDRHRLPTIITLSLLSLAVWAWSNSDYYFTLERRPPGVTFDVHPPQRIAETTQQPLLTVIAVDGGGIQAAGWAATVLTRVHESWPHFNQSLRFVSAISGGSVGTMLYVDALSPGMAVADGSVLTPEAVTRLERVRQSAVRGSLNEAAWGFAYPDLVRTIVPIPSFFKFEKDRGWAMERAWSKHWPDRHGPVLRDMTNGVLEGWRPAIALNSTRVETGGRFAFATFAAPAEWDLETTATMKGYKDRDIRLTTAARLSATFPYVTPISRARPEREEIPGMHFADGGYYDNTGMGIGMRWLDEALGGKNRTYKGNAVAFVRIRSGPTVSDTQEKDRGWLYQTIGPIQTLVAVRTAGQYERASTELEFLQRMWQRAGVQICSFEFAFEGASPPLSWQLTPNEVRHLDEQWRSGANQNVLTRLKAFASSHAAGCPAE